MDRLYAYWIHPGIAKAQLAEVKRLLMQRLTSEVRTIEIANIPMIADERIPVGCIYLVPTAKLLKELS